MRRSRSRPCSVGSRVVLRAAEEETVGGAGRLADDLRGVHGNVRRLAGLRAVEIGRKGARAGSSTTAKCTHWFSRRLPARSRRAPRRRTRSTRGSPSGSRPRTAGSTRSAEVEDGTRGARRQEQPAGHADRVLARQRLGRQLQVAAVAGQQQHPAELRRRRRTSRRCRAARHETGCATSPPRCR